MEKTTQDNPIMHSFTGKDGNGFLSMKIIVIFLVVILLGIGSGYQLAKANGASTIQSTDNVNKNNIQVGQTFGSNDTKTYKDTAEGVMRLGGINGEGQYHLERSGGATQNVYLTSSVVDLSLFVGHKIKVWGQTQAATYAGWLMDVGKVQVES